MSRPELLNELVREARREPIPSIDWDRVEGRLFERLEREPIRLASRSHSARRVFAIAAAAAVLVVLWAGVAPGLALKASAAASAHLIPPAEVAAADRAPSGGR